MCIRVPSIVHLGTVEMTIECVQGLSGPTVSQTWARLPSFITWNPYVLTPTGGPCAPLRLQLSMSSQACVEQTSKHLGSPLS